MKLEDMCYLFFFFQAEDGIRDLTVTGVQTCALPIFERVRADFPILRENVRGHQLVYLDNAATAQKPKAVIDAIVHYYEHDNANIHRGVHYLSERATEEFETARKVVQSFLNAAHASEIIFV